MISRDRLIRMLSTLEPSLIEMLIFSIDTEEVSDDVFELAKILFDVVEVKALEGDVVSMRTLSMLYLSGFPVGRDKDEGYKWLIKSAELGNKFAADEIFMIYLDRESSYYNEILAKCEVDRLKIEGKIL